MLGLKRRKNQIFICYRHDDSNATGRIYDRLIQRFGKEAVFQDIGSIPLGVNFRRHLESILSECAVVLVVIGNRWTDGFDNPQDFVLMEVEAAMRRDIRVIPLLVKNANFPMGENLPDVVKELSERNGMSIGHDPQFSGDVARLIGELEGIVYSKAQLAFHQHQFQLLMLGWIAMTFLLVAGLTYFVIAVSPSNPILHRNYNGSYLQPVP